MTLCGREGGNEKARQNLVLLLMQLKAASGCLAAGVGWILSDLFAAFCVELATIPASVLPVLLGKSGKKAFW